MEVGTGRRRENRKCCDEYNSCSDVFDAKARGKQPHGGGIHNCFHDIGSSPACSRRGDAQEGIKGLFASN